MKTLFALIVTLLLISTGCATTHLKESPGPHAYNKTKVEYYKQHRMTSASSLPIPFVWKTVTTDVGLANGQRTSSASDLLPAVDKDSPTVYAIYKEKEATDRLAYASVAFGVSFIATATLSGIGASLIFNPDIEKRNVAATTFALSTATGLVSSVSLAFATLFLNDMIDAREDAFMHYNSSLRQGLTSLESAGNEAPTFDPYEK